VGGRLVDWGAVSDDPGELEVRTERALAREGRAGELGAHVPPGEIDEVRIIGSWLASHPDAAQLGLRPAPDGATLTAFVRDARLTAGQRPGVPGAGPVDGGVADGGAAGAAERLLGEGELDDEPGDPVGAHRHA
jgi:hypothetical protein